MQATGDRLPWLNEEPDGARRTAAASPAPARVKAGPAIWLWYVLLGALIGAVAYGAWWLGTNQREAAAPQLPAEQPVAIPVTQVEPAPAATAEIPEGNRPETDAPATPTPARPALARTPTIERPAGRNRSDGTGSASTPSRPIGRSVFPADEPVIEQPPLAGPQPVVIYHPQPNRGRVVQLGAFPTRPQAEEAWRKITRRYPYLATKPKMVNTVDVGALGGGRRTRMYRLQLGTSSQAQSVVICQQLEKAGHSCVVVY